MKKDATDHLESLISELQAIEALTYKGFSFDMTQYAVRTDDDFAENIENITQHIISQRPSHQNLKIIVLRTG